MSLRLKFVAVITACAVVAAGWFLIVFRPNQKKASDLHVQVADAKAQVASLDAQLRHLQALQRNAPKLAEQQARYGAALPNVPRLPQFINALQDAANKAKVDFLSVAPSLPTAPTVSAPTVGTSAPATSPAPGSAPAPATTAATAIKEISVTLTTAGSYFSVENFIYRLEHLDRAVRIDNFAVASGGSGGGTAGGTSAGPASAGQGKLSVTMKLRMFVMPSVPAAPKPATPAKAGS